MGIVVGGFAIANLLYYFTDLSPAVIIGILSGAVTNTPSLGAAQQVLSEQGIDAAQISETGMAYAVAYPFGILGIIFTIMIIRVIFRINIKSEVENYNDSLGSSEAKLQSVEITVINSNLIGKNIDYLKHIMDRELAVSRIKRNGDSVIATDEEIIQEGDILCGVSSETMLENLRFKIGKWPSYPIKKKFPVCWR